MNFRQKKVGLSRPKTGLSRQSLGLWPPSNPSLLFRIFPKKTYFRGFPFPKITSYLSLGVLLLLHKYSSSNLFKKNEKSECLTPSMVWVRWRREFLWLGGLSVSELLHQRVYTPLPPPQRHRVLRQRGSATLGPLNAALLHLRLKCVVAAYIFVLINSRQIQSTL